MGRPNNRIGCKLKRFTDAEGREWAISLTIGHIKPIEAETGVNLLKLDKPFTDDSGDWLDQNGEPLALLTRLQLDMELLFSVIFASVMEQASELGVGPVEFGQAMAGKAHIDADKAFWEELSDFFQSARRTDLVAMIEKTRATINAGVAAAEKMAKESINPNEIVSKIFGKLSGEPAA